MAWIITNGVLSLGIAVFYGVLVSRVVNIMIMCQAFVGACPYSSFWPIAGAIIVGAALLLSIFNLILAYEYYKKKKEKFSLWLWFNIPLYSVGCIIYLLSGNYLKALLFVLAFGILLLVKYQKELKKLL